ALGPVAVGVLAALALAAAPGQHQGGQGEEGQGPADHVRRSPGGRSARGKESGRPLWQRPAAAIAPSRLGAALRAGGGAGASLLVLVLVAAADHASQQGRRHHQQREDLLHRIPTFPGGVNGNTENRNAPPTIDGENKACVGLLL